MNQNFPILSEPVAVLHRQTDAEDAEIPKLPGVTDDELGEILMKSLTEGQPANLSEAEAMESFAALAKSLGVDREQYLRVGKEYIAARHYAKAFYKSGCEF